MFPLGLVVFRDMLEITLFVGILATALRALPNQRQIITKGIVLGLIASLILALSSGFLKSTLSGKGADWFQLIVLTSVYLMLVWHVTWASQHGREMAQQAKQLGQETSVGLSSVGAVLIAIVMVTMREMSEIILYVMSVSDSADSKLRAIDYIVGGTGGMLFGVALGYLTYLSLSRISLSKVFNITNGFVVLMAAGMAGRIGKRLVKLEVIPAGANPIWDASSLIPESQPLGMFLHALIGYSEKPSSVQVWFFVAGLVLITVLWLWKGKAAPQLQRA